ncbi:hypothetical protein HY091_03465 [Candidatus Kaiserbacteria bacterium]|nr:hypothetical protein [Candidatus Kaiserbacteria bacterium]
MRTAAERRNLTDLRREEHRQAHIQRILSGLKSSFVGNDPGKNSAAYFFIKSFDGRKRRVIAAEFLGAGFDRSRINYPVVPLSTVDQHPCSTCGAEQPVIEQYLQTEDSPDGDTWLKEHFVLCFNCNGLFTDIERWESDGRF